MLALRNMLSIAPLYRLFQDLVGGNSRQEYVTRYVRPGLRASASSTSVAVRATSWNHF